MGEDNRLAPSGSVLLNHRPPTPPPVPSWGRVLATTVKLWVLRRWRLVAGVVALAVVMVAALGFSGVFAGTAVTAAQARAADRPSRAGAAPHRSGVATRAAAVQAESVQAEAAEWIAGQVSSDAVIACDPAMCAALQARGVAATRLMSLPRGSTTGGSTTGGSTDPRGAAVVVTSTAAYDQYAPAMIASFGSGAERIVVRAAEPGGTAGYQSAMRADLQARMSAGAQLLRNDRIRFTAEDAAQLLKGEVDTRVLATLAALSSQYSFSVTAFGDAAPGAAVLYRGMTITGGGLASALALVKAQEQPYLPAYAAIAQPAGGQPAALSVEFTAPSPLGLLTAVLTAARSSAAR